LIFLRYKLAVQLIAKNQPSWKLLLGENDCNFYRADDLFVHRIVTSELTFYLETLKTLHALPLDELADRTMDEIWTSR
jgi:hypothetical protein